MSLASQPWVAALLARPSLELLIDDRHDLPDDHLFTGLLSSGLLTDLICAFDRDTSTFYTLATVGASACGHSGIVHGGMSAAILDETLGGAVYCLKAAGVIGRGPAFTAALDVSYKTPLPAGSTIAVVAGLEKVEGRKAWVTAKVVSAVVGSSEGGGDDGGAPPTLYSEGRALFVVPKAAWEAAQARMAAAALGAVRRRPWRRRQKRAWSGG